ncbi:MAG TPA: caspase family protein [Pyrinomonadaceae bacterium]
MNNYPRLRSLALLVLTSLMARPTVVARKPTPRPEPQVGVSKPVSYPDRGGVETVLYEESHALVIGVSEYQNPLWSRLKNVPADVQEVAGVLAERGFRVEPLVMNPKREVLKKAINDFVDRYGMDEKNRLLVYFAGHGATLTSPDGRRRGFLVPSDAPGCPRSEERETPEYAAKARECARGTVTMDDIEAQAKNIQARHALFIFDSCFSGSVFDVVTKEVEPDLTAPDFNIPVPEDMKYPVRIFITSGSAEQRVPDNSIFRKLLVNVLKGKQADLARDGYITASELGLYLRRSVARLSNRTQTPQVGKINVFELSQGDFIFTLPLPAGGPGTRTAARSRPALFVPPRRQGEIEASVFSPDMRYILAGGADHTAYLWDVARGQEARRLNGHRSQIKAVAVSPDARYSLTGGADGRVMIWDNKSGEPRQTIEHESAVTAAAFSKDGGQILVGNADGKARLYKELGRMKNPLGEVNANDAAEFPGIPLTGPGSLFIGVRVFRGHTDEINSVAFSQDGRLILTASSDGKVRSWDASSGEQAGMIVEAGDPVFAASFSPDGRLILTAGSDPLAPLNLWETATGRRVNVNFDVDGPVLSAAFSPDGRRVAASSGRDVYLWDVNGANRVRLQGHTDRVTSVSFSPDAQLLLTGSNDNSLRLWQVGAGRELCRMISFTNETWAVIDPDGRFDTNDLEDNRSLRWTAPGHNVSLPLEIFMGEYYEPRLLPRAVSGETLPPINSLATVNRAQPQVSITKISRQRRDSDRVSVTVEVRSTRTEAARDGEKVMQESGVYDLRLFRDGQLVAQSPDGRVEDSAEGGRPEGVKPVAEAVAPRQDAPPAGAEADAASDELRLWRESKRVSLREDGRRLVTFTDIKLPRRKDAKQVEFSAYAFNSDRVKGVTDRVADALPKDLPPPTPRAYLINIGVDEYEGRPYGGLQYAALDAREMQRAFAQELSKVGEYEVVPILLTSETTSPQKTATKANIKAVFDLLSNREVGPEALRAIPNSDKLRAAGPDDLVIISMSSHGFTDAKGVFYLVPYDIKGGAPGVESDALKSRSISSDELSAWLRDVDAGDLSMILDSCNSGAVVGKGNEKFGPMGSRGLGQLAYDKGMRILVSSQWNERSFELNELRHGVLTYALAVDGLLGHKADFRPPMGEITLPELFAYSVERVPELSAVLQKTKVRDAGLPIPRDAGTSDQTFNVREESLQRPSLFDFARRGKKEVVLSRTKASPNSMR